MDYGYASERTDSSALRGKSCLDYKRKLQTSRASLTTPKRILRIFGRTIKRSGRNYAKSNRACNCWKRAGILESAIGPVTIQQEGQAY